MYSRHRLLLRSSNTKQLGIVKRLYLEANGSFTLIKNPEPHVGLCVLPNWVICHNFSDQPQVTTIQDTAVKEGRSLYNIISEKEEAILLNGDNDKVELTLDAYGYKWFRII